MKRKILLTLTAIASLTIANYAHAEMPIDARHTAYFVGKAASHFPAGYITAEFLRKLAIATGCNTSYLIEDFVQTERDQEQYFRTH
jgi:hypothetical protein